MVGATKAFSVHSDSDTIRTVLVQKPLAASSRGRTGSRAGKTVESRHEAAGQQHERLVRALEGFGVQVLHLDELLAATLAFADARDWTLDRRLAASDPDLGRSFAVALVSWLNDLPPKPLAEFLIAGACGRDLPGVCRKLAGARFDPGKKYLPALPNLARTRANARWLKNGVVLGHAKNTVRRNEVVNTAAVLHFSPVFDEALFDFWLSTDPGESALPDVDGRDFAMPDAELVVGALTAHTGNRALRLLAAALFREGVADRLLCADLAGTAAGHLDDYLIPLGRDCMLTDFEALENARAFVIRPVGGGNIQAMDSHRASFLKVLTERLERCAVTMIDAGSVRPKRSGGAPARFEPIVLAPGKVLAFEEHSAVFPLLESHGIEIAAVTPGSELSRFAAGPRAFATVVSAHP